MKSDLNRIFGRIVVAESGCWVYQGGVSSNGYGIVSVNNKSVQVHRVAFELRVSRIPDGQCVCHRCDVRLCINPEHLFLGTKGENNTDRRRKGRNDVRRGESNHMAKLTEQQAIELIEKVTSQRISSREAAERFGITQKAVNAIVRGARWAHLDRAVQP